MTPPHSAAPPSTLDPLVADTALVAAAYDARALAYQHAVGGMHHVSPADRAFVEAWAEHAAGALLDVGCGPGQWTAHLFRRGASIAGRDPSAAFIALARGSAPGIDFQLGTAEHLDVPDGALGGILAWYSLIHTNPALIDRPLREFARCLAPTGTLALGFFTGEHVEPFPHAIVQAYRWPAALLASRVTKAGFRVTEIVERTDVGQRPHGALVAVRTDA